MNVLDVMAQLEALGTQQTKKTFIRHGAPGPLFGVKIGDLKKYLVKEVKKNQQLALDLFDTGNSDAQYLAGLAINPKLMTKNQLEHWADTSNWSAISEAIVASVTAESPYAIELALKWIHSDDELLEDTGWSCYGKFLSIAPDTAINHQEVLLLLNTIEQTIHQAKNAVRYTMNGFVISVGCYCPSLLDEAKKTALTIGAVNVRMGDTACKVPLAITNIEKAVQMNRVGKKRKRAVC